MSIKPIDPSDTYEVRELFSCGEGHFLTPVFTHWEEGEVCPHGHNEDASNEDVHLYYRRLAIATKRSDSDGGGDTWEFFLANPGKWGHAPLAPEGLAVGTQFGPKTS
jgi:hypothetical protein